MVKGTKEYQRKKSLGELGELFAVKALVDQCYDKIRNLNDVKMNFPYADLYGEIDGQKQVISVKARNMYQSNGALNSTYNLGDDCRVLAKVAEDAFDAEACWMAVQFDTETYTIYMGKLSELIDRNSIPLKRCADGTIGKCLVKDKKHYFDFSYFKQQGVKD
ncbi:hypothetical protein FJQ87_10635 [Shewanella sp. SNU WT4]|nr:hypothetical protein FJQ87_10635 [Shewanella sp. SNU WT4]